MINTVNTTTSNAISNIPGKVFIDNNYIEINKSNFTINSDGDLSSTSNPATYKWVLFNSNLWEFELLVNSVDIWICLHGDDNSAIAVSVKSESLNVGATRHFTMTGRIDFYTGNSILTKASTGDKINITKENNLFTFKIKRVDSDIYSHWFTLNTSNFYGGLSDRFGILTGSSSGTICRILPGKISGTMANITMSNETSLFESAFEAATGTMNEVDLIIFMGQSNMAGRGNYTQAPTVPTRAGFEFRAITDPTKLYSILEPFGVNENNPDGMYEPGMKTGSMVSSFVIEYNKIVGRTVVAVSASKGGSSIDLWQPNGAYLSDAIARFTAARTWLTNNGYTIKHQFMVWCQGETDGDNGMSKVEYTAKIIAMIEAMVSAGVEKCYIIRIGNNRDNPTKYDEMISAETDLCKTYKNAVLVSTKFAAMAEEGMMKDEHHYYQIGYNITGSDAGINTAFHVRNQKEPIMYDPKYNNVYISRK